MTAKPTRALVVLLGAYFVLAIAYGAVNPAFEAPDENAHFYFARHLADGGSLPVQPMEPDERGLWEQEGSQPPLYYYLAAAAMRLPGVARRADGPWYNHQTSMGTPSLVVNENRFVHGYGEGRLIASDLWMARLLSAVLGALTVVGVWVIAGAAFPDRPLLWTATAAVAALNPQFLYLAGSASNDALVVTLATVALAAVTRVADGRAGKWTLAVLAVSAGLAPLTKLSGLAVLGFVSASVAVLALRRRSVRLVATAVVPGLLVALVATGWWYARNLSLYGDLTGISRMLPGDTRRDFVWDKWLAGLGGELEGLWRSFWGLFGWFTLPLPDWVYGAIDIVVVLALAGLLLAAARRAGFVRWGTALWLGLWLGVVFASLLRWMMLAKGGHGRLLFPALASVAVLLVLGLRAIAPRRLTDGALALGTSGALGALAIFALVGVIRPAYARPAPVPALPASAQAVWSGWSRAPVAPVDVPSRTLVGAVGHAYFTPPDTETSPEDTTFSLSLDGIEIPPRSAPGGIPVTLFWKSVLPHEAELERTPGSPWDGFVGLRLDVPAAPGPWNGTVESGDKPAMPPISGPTQLAYLGRGALPPALMSGGQLYADARIAPQPVANADMPAQPYLERLSVHLFNPERGRWELTGDAGPAGGGDEWAAWLVREPLQLTTAPPRPPDGILKGRIFGERSGRWDWKVMQFDDGYGVQMWADVKSGQARPELQLTWRRSQEGQVDGTVEPWPTQPHSGPDEPVGDAKATSVVPTVPAVLNFDTEADLSVFVHFLDSTGAVIAQADGPPSNDAYFPTWAWQPGDVVSSRPIPIPDGAVSAAVGLYDPVSQMRLAVHAGGGNPDVTTTKPARWAGPDALVIPLAGDRR